MKNPVRRSLIALLLISMSSVLFAAPVKWYLKDVVIQNGFFYAFGSFVYDADTGLFTEIDIVASSTFAGQPGGRVTFADPNPGSPGNAIFINVLEDASATTLIGQQALAITLMEELTDAGGTIDIDVDAYFSRMGICAEDDLGRECGVYADAVLEPRITGGSVTSVKPGPTKWYLQNVKLADGGRAIGSFVFDSETENFSAIDIVTTNGTSASGAKYGDPNPISIGVSSSIILVEDAAADTLVGQRGLILPFLGELRNGGDILGVDLSEPNGEGECVSDNENRECGAQSIDRQITSGRVSSIQPGAQITAGLNGAWFQLSLPGQGIFIDVYPDIPLLFLAWFTYDLEGAGDGTSSVIGDAGHRWVTAQGQFRGNEAVLDVFLTTGGIFANRQEVVTSPADSYGRIVLTFLDDCKTASIDYEFFESSTAGGIILQRIANDNVALCLLLSEGQE